MLTGQCERCGELFTDSIWRHAWRPQRRFCSERCRKAAEGRRYRLRKKGGLNA